jgi:peptide/nickel transport system substrate-binding protein
MVNGSLGGPPRRRWPAWRLLAGAATLALALGACSTAGSSSAGSSPSASGSSATSTGSSSRPLVVDLAGGTGTLDPAQACGGYDIDFVSQFYIRLTKYGSTAGPSGTTQFDPAKIQPWLAKSYTVSPDGRTYTFTLPAGLKFANGDPLNAAAVAASLNRSIDNGGCGGYFLEDGIYTPAPLVKSITATGATTVVAKLTVADANFPQDLAQPGAAIVDTKVVDANGGTKKGVINKWMQSHIAGGSGPYVLSSYSPNVSATLTANPNYPGTPPASKTIQVNFIGDDSTLLLRARSGEADVTLGMSAQAAHSLTGNSCCKVIANPTTKTEEILLPANHYPVSNANFRAALSYALPYSDILNKIEYGYGQLYFGPYPPLMAPEYNASTETARPFDLAKAKSLLAASGVKTPVKLTMIIDGSAPASKQLATIAQGAWAALGVQLTISTLTDASFETTINTNPKPYQVGITADGPGVIDAGYYLGYDMLCNNSYNAGGICVPAADKLYTQARTTVNAAQRLSLYQQLIPLWTAQTPKIPVFATDDVTVLSARVTQYHYANETEMWDWAAG